MITASLIAIAHVAGTLAAVVVAAFLAVAVVCAFGAIAGCVVSSRASAAEDETVSGSRCVSGSTRVSTEPDPIETYNQTAVMPPSVFVHRHGHMPIPLNPLGQSEHSMRIRE
jgi:hypothetical protein